MEAACMMRTLMALMPLVGGRGRLRALTRQNRANLMLRRDLSMFSP